MRGCLVMILSAKSRYLSASSYSFLPPSLERPPDSSAFVEAGNAESLIQLVVAEIFMRSPTGVHSEAFRRYYLQPVNPQTLASPQERFQALDALVQRHPDLGKRLLIALLPGTSELVF